MARFRIGLKGIIYYFTDIISHDITKLEEWAVVVAARKGVRDLCAHKNRFCSKGKYGKEKEKS